jgi:hypothetical protein
MTRVIAIFFALFFAVPALAETDEARMRALVQRVTNNEHETLSKARYAGEYTLSDLVTYSNHQGRLVATFHLPADLVKQFADPAPLIISLKASPQLWTISRRKSGTLDEGLSLITLTCYAPDETQPFNRYSLSSDGDRVMVSGSQMFGHPATQQSVLMNQGERGMHLAWRLASDRFTPRSLNVAELSQVPARAPDLEERYLMPIFRRLGPGRPASDVYRVFDQIPADPAVTRSIMPLLVKLDSDDSAVRDAATASLKRMGAPAILSCMRMDRSLLTPEQNGRIDAFCSTDGWVHVSDVEAARHDPDFLTACLEDEDPAVRLAAANLLAALKTAAQLRK